MKGLFVTGTDTHVGKTWVGSKLIAELVERKIQLRARKPIESGWPVAEKVTETDAWKLSEAMGQTDSLDLICPNRYAAAISPDRAAMLEGDTITLEQLKQDCLNGLNDNDFLYVEGAGGFYSPISHDGLNADLPVSLNLPVMLVVEDRLGCINQTLLNVEAIKAKGLKLHAIVLNQPNVIPEDIGMDNLSDIQKRVDCEVISFVFNQDNTLSIMQLADIILAKQ